MCAWFVVCLRISSSFLILAAGIARQARLCFCSAMPQAARSSGELLDSEAKVIMKKALEIVDSNFDPATHLPEAVYKFLQPIADTTCQGTTLSR